MPISRGELWTDGPHSDDYTAEVARTFAEVVRVLNYATGSHGEAGLTCPQTVYTVVGNLAAGASGLGQLFRQLSAFLDAEVKAGRLADTCDVARSPEGAANDARRHLAAAHVAARELTRDLTAAQGAVSGLYVPGDDGEGRS